MKDIELNNPKPVKKDQRDSDLTQNAKAMKNAYMVPNPMMPNQAILFDEEPCTGCNICVHVCRTDVLMPNPEKGKPPILLYPDECWYCGVCVADCPSPGSIAMLHPLHQSVVVNWKRKETGETYRLGMRNPPAANTTPPSGD